MPSLNPMRRLPWFVVLQAVIAARRHWTRLEADERADLQRLVRKSRGKPNNLDGSERARVRELAGKLDVVELGRGLMPFGGGRRRKR